MTVPIRRPTLEVEFSAWLDDAPKRACYLYLGESGMGKTTLSRQLIKGYLTDKDHVQFAKYDLEEFSTIEQMLYVLREQLRFRGGSSAGLEFPSFARFEYCLSVLRKRIDPLDRSEIETAHLRLTQRVSDALNTASGFEQLTDALQIADVGSIVTENKWVKGPISKYFNSWMRHRVLERYPDLKRLEDSSMSELRALLVTYFWSDLEIELAKDPSVRVAFVLDNHQSLTSPQKFSGDQANRSVAEFVLAGTSPVMLALFSRAAPTWWSKEVSADRSRGRDENDQGESATDFKIIRVGEFSLAEVSTLISNGLLSGGERGAASAMPRTPYLLAAQLALWQSEGADGVGRSSIATSMSELHERILSGWATEECTCLAAVNRLGTFGQDDLKAIANQLGYRLRADTFHRLLRSASAAIVDPSSVDTIGLHSLFSTALEAHLQADTPQRDWVEKEIRWFQVATEYARLGAGLNDIARYGRLMRALGLLPIAALDRGRRYDLLEIVERTAEVLRFSAGRGEFQALPFSFEIARVGLLCGSENDEAFLLRLTAVINLLASTATRLGGAIDSSSVARVNSVLTAWAQLLGSHEDKFGAEHQHALQWAQLWSAKLLDDARLIGRHRKVRGSPDRQRVDLALSIERLSRTALMPAVCSSLVSFAADQLSLAARWGAEGVEVRTDLYWRSVALKKNLAREQRHPVEILSFCEAVLGPPAGVVVPPEELELAVSELAYLMRSGSNQDRLQYLSARALVRLAYHRRDAGDVAGATRFLDLARHQGLQLLQKSGGADSFIPARILMRVLRKRRAVLGETFDPATEGHIVRAALWHVHVVGEPGMYALIGQIGTLSPRSELADIISVSDKARRFIVGSLVALALDQPKEAEPKQLTHWLEQRTAFDIEAASDPAARIALINNTLSALQPEQPNVLPVNFHGLHALLRLELAIAQKLSGLPVTLNEIGRRYAQWAPIAVKQGRDFARKVAYHLNKSIRLFASSAEVGALYKVAKEFCVDLVPDDFHFWPAVDWPVVPLGSEPEGRTTRVAVASLLTASWREYEQEQTHRRMAGRRYLFEAVAFAEKGLPAEDALGQAARSAFLKVLWEQLRLQSESDDVATPKESPAHEYVHGPRDDRARRLLEALSTLPAAERLLPGMMIVGTPLHYDPERDCVVFSIGARQVTVARGLIGLRYFDRHLRRPGEDSYGLVDAPPALLTILGQGDGTRATMRGAKHVMQVLQLVFPNAIIHARQAGVIQQRIWLGASNSWAVAQMSSPSMRQFLSDDGSLLEFVEDLAAINRITILPRVSAGGGGLHLNIAEMKLFIRYAWRALEVNSIIDNTVVLMGSREALNDARKRRTFEAMMRKVLPEMRVAIVERPVASIFGASTFAASDAPFREWERMSARTDAGTIVS